MANDSEALHVIKTGVQFAGEVLVPGGSNLVRGDFKGGLIYTAVGLAARAYFGFPALLLVSASSLSKATTGKHLYEYIDALSPSPAAKQPEPVEVQPSTPAPAHS